jgi:hypothetical protein
MNVSSPSSKSKASFSYKFTILYEIHSFAQTQEAVFSLYKLLVEVYLFHAEVGFSLITWQHSSKLHVASGGFSLTC